MQEMQKAMAIGPAYSIGVCRHLAPQIEAEIEQETGWAVRRTSMRVPNPANVPDQDERGVLLGYAARASAGQDPALADIETRLAAQPDISVPTIVLKGADDGVDPPTVEDEDGHHFSGEYARRIVPGAGHNPPQEAPDAFVNAVLSVASGQFN